MVDFRQIFKILKEESEQSVALTCHGGVQHHSGNDQHFCKNICCHDHLPSPALSGVRSVGDFQIIQILDYLLLQPNHVIN